MRNGFWIADFRLRIADYYRYWFRNPQSAIQNRDGLVVDGGLLSKLDRLSLVIGRDLISGLMGEHRAQRRTSGIEFVDYRPYSPGDDLRSVDWNAYARLGALYVRQDQAEHDTALYLLVDGSPSMEFGQPTKFLAARRIAAALGYIALSHLDNVVVAAPGIAGSKVQSPKSKVQDLASPVTDFGPSNPKLLRGRAESGDLFRYLQGLKTGKVASFDGLLAGWGVGRGRGRIAVIISDLLLDEYQDGVRQLAAAGFQVTLLHMLNPEEIDPPRTGDLELIDSETNEIREIHLGEEAFAQYKRNLNAWLEETEAWCISQGAGYVRIHSDWDTERVLLDILRRRGVTM